MRDVIFPLPGLAGGDEFGGTVIFKNLLNSNLYYTISIQNFMLYNIPSHHLSLRLKFFRFSDGLNFFDSNLRFLPNCLDKL